MHLGMMTSQGHVIYTEFRVPFISPEPFKWFSLKFTQLIVLFNAEPIYWLRRLNVRVTLQGHEVYQSIYVRSLSPKY